MASDSGLYAYGGQQILLGKLIYRDVWDNKPPGVFYLNALALLLFGNTAWAIWWNGVIWVISTVLALFFFINKVIGRAPAFLGAFLFLMTLMYPDYYEGGNLTEIYALLPQILCLWVSYAYFAKGNRNGWVFLLGLMTAFASLFKQTYIAIGFASIAVVILFDFLNGKKRNSIYHILLYSAGFMLPWIAASIYWGSQGELINFWQSTIIYNLFYTESGFSRLNLYVTFRTIFIVPPLAILSAISVISWVVFFMQNLPSFLPVSFKKGRDFKSNSQSIEGRPSEWKTWALMPAFIAFPFEVLLLFISGRHFGHYFITPLPAITVIVAYFIGQVPEGSKAWKKIKVWQIVVIAILLPALSVWCVDVVAGDIPRNEHLSALDQPLYGSPRLNQLHTYVLDHTDPTQSMLVWGFHPDINFLTNRRSPSKYLYHFHLFYLGETRNRFSIFIGDLQRDPPALILAQEVSSSGVPFFGAEGENLCPGCIPEAREGMEALKTYVEQHYILEKTIYDWLIFKRIENGV
jgi:hypothetical protein